MKVTYLALAECYGAHHAGFVHSYNIARELEKAGVDVTLVMSRPENPTIPDIQSLLVELPRSFSFSPRKLPDYAAGLHRLWKTTSEADIIHERFHINPIDLLFTFRKKYVLEINDPAMILTSGFRKILNPVIGLKLARADAIIVQTETLKDIISGFTSKPIHVVPNGVDTSLFKNCDGTKMRKKLRIPVSDILITFVGSFREWHGVQDIPEIAKLVLKGNPRCTFLLVGSGPLLSAVKRTGTKTRKIIFYSAEFDEIPQILMCSDILIAPFSTENFAKLEEHGFWWSPLKLYEYMAAGRPVVSYDFAEVRKIVGAGAMLAAPGNVQDFATKTLLLSKNRSTREATGRRAKKLSFNYDWFYPAKKIASIYRGLGKAK